VGVRFSKVTQLVAILETPQRQKAKPIVLKINGQAEHRFKK